MRKSLHHLHLGRRLGMTTRLHAEQASLAHKRRKTSLTKCDDEYTVSKRREALSAKANTGKFSGLHAPHIQVLTLPCVSCLLSLAFSLVYALFVACAHSLALHVSPKKILKYTTLFWETQNNVVYFSKIGRAHV